VWRVSAADSSSTEGSIRQKDFEHFVTDAGMDAAARAEEGWLFAVQGGSHFDPLAFFIDENDRPYPGCQEDIFPRNDLGLNGISPMVVPTWTTRNCSSVVNTL